MKKLLSVTAIAFAALATAGAANAGLKAEKERLEVRGNEAQVEHNDREIAKDEAALDRAKDKRWEDRKGLVKETLKGNKEGRAREKEELRQDNVAVKNAEGKLERSKQDRKRNEADLAKDREDEKKARGAH